MIKSKVNIRFDLENMVMKMQEEGKSLTTTVPMDGNFYDLDLLGISKESLEDLNNFRMGFRLIHLDQEYLAFQTANNKAVVIKERNLGDLQLLVLNKDTYYNDMSVFYDSHKKLYSMLELLSYSYNKLTDEAFKELIHDLELQEFYETAVELYKSQNNSREVINA